MADGAAPQRQLTGGQGQSGSLLSPVKQGRLAEQVYESLFHLIISEMSPGDRLPTEQDLAATFQVSRPIVRQALTKLREDNMITSQRGSGSYVCDEKQRRIAEIDRTELVAEMTSLIGEMEFRLALEVEAAGLAALRRSEEDLNEMASALRMFEEALAAGAPTWHFDYLFHVAVARATGNPRFAEAIEPMMGTGTHKVLRNQIHFQPSDRGMKVLEEHRRVFELIAQQDVEKARISMRTHIERARLRIASSGL